MELTISPGDIQFDGDKAEWSKGPLRFEARILADEDPDLSYLGEFSRTPGDPDVTIEHRGRFGTLPYFIAEGGAENAQRNYERAISYGDGWTMCGIVVTAFCGERQLDEQSLWGIESDSGRAFFAEEAAELANEAIASWQEPLTRGEVTALIEAVSTEMSRRLQLIAAEVALRGIAK